MVQPSVNEEVFGSLPDGREVKIFTLTNRHGMRARVTEFGAILVSLEAPDRDGRPAHVALGYDSLAGWLGDSAFLGASVGRFGNRIAAGRFTLNGREYRLATNNEPGGIPCHLHGGEIGFHKLLWSGEAAAGNSVVFSRVSPDGEEGYPGNLACRITYTLTDDNELKWQAEATTDAPTVVNLVHHSYWNLSGDPGLLIDDHELVLAADHYLPTDAGQIPTGELAAVAGTPMDFTEPAVIGARVDDDFEALRLAGGYDHAWVLRPGDGVRPAARLKDPKTGRVMSILTNQPAIQFYSGNFLDGSLTGREGVAYTRRSGLCLETEGFPDAPNRPAFPSAVLRPGQTYRHLMIHRFSVE